jgi:hypothetical protein
MRSLVLTAVVTPEHTVTIAVPPDIPPGPHEVVLVIQEEVQTATKGVPDFLNWPAHPVGPTDPSCTYRREDLYGDDGR